MLAAEKALEKAKLKPRPPGVGKRDRRYRYATQTIRCIKSACVHEASAAGDRWHQDDQAMTEVCLAGIEATGACPDVRGHLDSDQFEIYLKHCRKLGLTEYAEAALVQYGTGIRPRDVKALCLARVFEKPSGLLGVEIKAPAPQKIRAGIEFPRPVVTKDAERVLRERVKAWMKAGLKPHVRFYDIDPRKVKAMLTELRDKHGWSTDVLLDSQHVFRHTMAADTFDRAVSEVRERGAWESVTAAVNYGVKGVSGRRKATAAKQRQLDMKRKRARRQ